MKKISIPLLFVSTALALASGCQIVGHPSYRAEVSQETASTLSRMSSVLESRGAELRFECSPDFFGDGTSCRIDIDGTRQPELDAQIIDRPFTGEPMLLRIAGGTEALNGGLYDAMAELTTTGDFQGQLDERKLALEGGKFKIRCVATREATPTHQCWTLVAHELLR